MHMSIYQIFNNYVKQEQIYYQNKGKYQLNLFYLIYLLSTHNMIACEL